MEINIKVLENDCISIAADVLILKYPQEFHKNSADSAAKESLLSVGIELPVSDLRPNQVFLTETKRSLGAKNLCICGVKPLRDFRFREISLFIESAIRTIQDRRIEPEVIATTIHGLHYGLDEYDCLKAILNGLYQALSKGVVPESLKEFRIAEPTKSLCNSYKVILKELVPSGSIEWRKVGDSINVTGLSVGDLEPPKALAFVAMPFNDETDPIFDRGIRQGLRGASIASEIVNRQRPLTDIATRIHDSIKSCDILIGDVTGLNPNVMYEIGCAAGLEIDFLLITQDTIEKLPFDIRTRETIPYDKANLPALADKISERLTTWLLKEKSNAGN